MANRIRDYYRKMRKRAIARRKPIIRGYLSDNIPHSYLSKHKIRCSCPMCGFHGKSKHDKKSFNHLEYELIDYCYSDEEDFDEVLPGGVSTLISKIRKEKNGVWYPNIGYSGTKVYPKKGRKIFDYDEYKKIMDTDTLLKEFCSLFYSNYNDADRTIKYRVIELNKLLSDNNLEVHSIEELIEILKNQEADYKVNSILRHYKNLFQKRPNCLFSFML